MRRLARLAAVLIGLCAAPVSAQDFGRPAKGDYTLDLGHTRLLFRVDHLGFSRWTALFTEVSATLAFDPDAPQSMAVQATVMATSIETHYPDPALDFNATLRGKDFLNTDSFPEITFTSTAVRPTGDRTAEVTGDLTLLGVTRPVTLNVTYNGGWGDMPMDAGARIGFSATGAFNRSDFGMVYGLPPEGTTMGVSDRVEVILEAEFIRPRP